MTVNYSKYGTSYNEQLIFLSMRHFYNDAVNRAVVLKDKIDRGLEFDIAVPSLKLCIEYSPTSTHGKHFGNGGNRDLLKKEICRLNNVRFIEIIEDTFNKLEHYCEKDKYCFCDRIKNDISIYDVIDSILKDLGHSINELELDSIRREAYKRSNSRCLPEKSIKALCSEMATEWNESSINTDEISPYSHIIVHWKCNKCGYGKDGEWYVMTKNRVEQQQGCPKCGWNIFKNEYNNINKNRYMIKSLANTYPELAKELNVELTGKTAAEIPPGFSKKVFWTCIKCGYGSNGEWQVKPNSRTYCKNGCPRCKKKLV